MTDWKWKKVHQFLIMCYTFSEASGAFIQSCNIANMYKLSFPNDSWSCEPCTICLPDRKTSQPCRYNRDTVCEQCPPGTYIHVTQNTEECRRCSQCRPGQYVDRQCGRVQDRVCKPCAPGYYSPRTNSKYCQRCTQCSRKEKRLRFCKGKANSVCNECEQGYYREAATWRCVPCSECQDVGAVPVPECIRKMGKESNSVCQPRILFNNRDFLTTTELAMFEDQETNTPVDALVFTTPVISIIVVICSALVCIVLLRKLLYRALCRTKQPHLTVSDNISIKDVSLLTELSPYDDQREQNEHKLTTFDYSVRKQHTQSLTMDVSIERKLELYNVSTKSLNQLETLVPKT